MTMKFDLTMDELNYGDKSIAASSIFETAPSANFPIADLDPYLFEAKGSSLHRYRSLELLEEAAKRLDKITQSDSIARSDIISNLRVRWEPIYRVHKEDWPSIYQQIDQYSWPSAKKPAVKKSTRVVRRFIEAVMWVADTGAKWSYLPRSYGRWQVVQERFLRWLDLGYWNDIVRCLSSKDQRSSLTILMENHYAIRRSNALALMILGRKKP